jgi:glucose-6-phosphate 1-dehydrogenase
VVIFSASGDLSKRKLIPTFYQLQNSGYLPNRYAVVGFSRTAMTDEAYGETMVKALQEQMQERRREETTAVRADHPFINALHYQPGNADDPGSFKRLKVSSQRGAGRAQRRPYARHSIWKRAKRHGRLLAGRQLSVRRTNLSPG